MAVLVAGMHRSGTSVLSRMVGLMLGYDGQAGAAFDNVEGHWEDPALNRLLDRVLLATGHDWASPPVHGIDWSDPRLAPLRRELASTLRPYSAPPWVLKDPRLCLTLDEVARHTDARCVVATFRDPVEVASSVASRDGYEPEYGLALWEIYTRQLALGASRGRVPVAWVTYGDLLGATHDAVERLDGHLRSAGLQPSTTGTEEARIFVRADLRHQQGGGSSLGLSRSQQRLLDLVSAAAAGGPTPAEDELPQLTGWARALVETRRPFATMERQNRLLRHRLRRVRPLFRAVDRVRRVAGRPVPPDPFADA